MYLMYVDESGDTGLNKSPTNYFALSALVVHESRWRELINLLIAFRKTLRATYGLPLRTEIHAAEFIRHPPVPGMEKHIRLAIMRNLLDELAKIDFISFTNVIVDKRRKTTPYDVFLNAWQTLFQRFENTMNNANFPGRYRSDNGIVINDNTDGLKLQKLVRRMAVYNPIPHMASLYGMGSGYRIIPLRKIIEDPNSRDSKYSYLIQSCDVVAYFLLQKFLPNNYIRRNGAHNYFDRLRPVLNTWASTRSALGIVTL
jgi:Protein of unknown function (DUF3800)